MTSLPTWLLTVLFTALVGVALYFRFRRSFGRQRIRSTGVIIRIVILLAAASFLFMQAPIGLETIAAALAGFLLGGGLGMYALSRTVFEREQGEVFYTANKWISLALLALVVGRLIARFVALRSALSQPNPEQATETLQRSPLTLGIFFLMVGYYLVYYIGVMKRGRELSRSAQIAKGTSPS